MTKGLASLILVLTLGAGPMVGMPMHSGGGESGMMDCCKQALEKNDSPTLLRARLLLRDELQRTRSTSGNSSQSFSQRFTANQYSFSFTTDFD